MDAFLAFEDSLRVLRYARASGEYRLLPCTAERLAAAETQVDPGLLREAIPVAVRQTDPAQPTACAFFSKEARSQSLLIRPVLQRSALTDGAYLELVRTDGLPLVPCAEREVHLFVESPGLSLVRAGRTMLLSVGNRALSKEAALVRLAAFGMELCGSFARDPWNPHRGGCAYDVPPASTIDDLRCFVEEADRAPGVSVARRALPHIREGLASPAEVLVYLGMCLPARLGGAGFPEPRINAQVEWPEEVGSLRNHQAMRPDFWWPEHALACEVNGKDHESGEKAFEEDANRQQDYALCGIALVPARRTSFRSTAAFERLLAKLGHLMSRHEGAGFARRVDAALTDPDARRARTVLLGQLRPPVERFA